MNKSLTAIAKANGMKYRELKDMLLDANIITLRGKSVHPTEEAIKLGIAVIQVYGNERVLLNTYYHYDEDLIYEYVGIGLSKEVNQDVTYVEGDDMPF